MNKGERISQLVAEVGCEAADDPHPGDADERRQRAADRSGAPLSKNVSDHPYYRAFFRCWNAQRYYDAHDVLEQLWLQTKSRDADYFKGLIQAAGAFVHLKKHFEHPSHAKHGRRLSPAVRLFRLAEKNLSSFGPRHYGLDVAALCQLLHACADQIVASGYTMNPWSPKVAPKLTLM